MFNIVTKELPQRKPDAALARLQPLMGPAIVALVGLTAFGLGRLSALETQRAPLRIMQDGQLAAPAAAPAGDNEGSGGASPAASRAGNFVASKSGTKYYAPGCSGASRIKAENQVWFASADEAQAAGYEKAANCP